MPAPDWSLLLRTPAFETTALLLGLVVGSFANVCIHRLPRRESVVFPPSRCPACGALIQARDNVPVARLAAPARPLPCVPRPDLLALPRGRGRERPPVAGARRARRPAAADLRGDGPGHGPPRPGPDRPRPPDPARRDHAAGDRGGTGGELPAGLGGVAARRRRRGRGRLAGVRRRGQGVRAHARDRGPRAGGLEDGGDARGVPRVAGDAARRAPRLGGGHRGGPRRGRAARPRHAVRPAARDLPGGRRASRSSSSGTGSWPGTAGSSVADLRRTSLPPRAGAGPRGGRPLRDPVAAAGRSLGPAGCAPASRTMPKSASWRPGRGSTPRSRAAARRPGTPPRPSPSPWASRTRSTCWTPRGASSSPAPRPRPWPATSGRTSGRASPRAACAASWSRRARRCGRSSTSGCRATGGARPFAWPRPRPTSRRSCASGSRSSWATWRRWRRWPSRRRSPSCRARASDPPRRRARFTPTSRRWSSCATRGRR